MKIKISYPNDFGSEADSQAAIDECCNEDGIFEAMAQAARGAGLAFVEATDYGAIWRGSADQVAASIAALPAWASNYHSPIEEEENADF